MANGGNGNGGGSSGPRVRVRVADDPGVDFSADDAGLPPLPSAAVTRPLRPEAEARSLSRSEAKGYTSPLETDPWIYRIAVGALSLVVLGSGSFYFILTMADKTMPEALVGLASAAMTALVLLVKKKE